jgi:hypothetical protein
MHKTLFAGLLAVALAITPVYAAKTKTHTKKKAAAHKVSKTPIEDEAWGGTSKTKHPATKPAAKTAKKGSALKPTVKLDKMTPSKPVVAAKPTPAPTTQVKPAADNSTDNKSAEDMEKQAHTEAKKNPKAALATYEKLVQNNPNYTYAGDVYADMYRLSQKTGADTLTQLKYAGMAGQKLQAGLSRRPVTQQQILQYQRLEEKLQNQWIETEIRKIMAGQE